MNLEITHAQFGVKPPVTKPIPEFLIEVGEEGIRKLAHDHYEKIRDSKISFLFPSNEEDFEKAKEHAADFLIQICGGRAYFTENRGAPKMVQRHARFRIDNESRVEWLELYKPLLLELKDKGVTETSLQSFWNYLNIFSIWMINTK